MTTGTIVYELSINDALNGKRPVLANPCPFCGSKDLFMEEFHRRTAMWAYWVECRDCGAHGPVKDMPKDEAVLAWNLAQRLLPTTYQNGEMIENILDAFDEYQPTNFGVEDVEALRKAAKEWVSKLEAVHNDPRYIAVWHTAHAHIGPYEGPQYHVELAALTDAINPTTKLPPLCDECGMNHYPGQNSLCDK